MALFGLFKRKKNKTCTSSTFLPQQMAQAESLELKDIIAPSALKVRPRELNLGDKFVRTFLLFHIHDFSMKVGFAPVINLDKVFDVSIFVHPIDTVAALRQFQKRLLKFKPRFMKEKTRVWFEIQCSIPRIKTLKIFETVFNKHKKNL